MAESDFLERNFTLPNWIEVFIHNFKERRSHPDYLSVNGIICFCGEQGSGKTLSAVRYVYNVCRRFPSAVVCTNITLNWDLDNEIVPYEGVDQMVSLDNGPQGVVFLIDEMHLEFNSLESKGMDSRTFELVSQQRKARKHIVGTSQVFGRLAKPFREQFKIAVLCRNLFGSLFIQQCYRAKNVAYEDDIRTELNPHGTYIYFASPDFFSMYDTSEIVRRVNNGFVRS